MIGKAMKIASALRVLEGNLRGVHRYIDMLPKEEQNEIRECLHSIYQNDAIDDLVTQDNERYLNGVLYGDTANETQ